MSPGRRFLLTGLLVAFAMVSPAAALGAANGTDLPLIGSSTQTNTLIFATDQLTSQFAGQLSHLGAFTGRAELLFTPTGLGPPVPYTETGTATLVAANGDELFETVSGTGTASGTTAGGTNVVTITGGTGRFTDASGTYTETYSGPITFNDATSVTGTANTIIQGHISY